MLHEQMDEAAEHSNGVQDFVIHLGIFLAVMTMLAFIAAMAENWAWFVAAFIGWAIVIVGQALYVFVLRNIGVAEDIENAAVRDAAQDLGNITPGA